METRRRLTSDFVRSVVGAAGSHGTILGARLGKKKHKTMSNVVLVNRADFHFEILASCVIWAARKFQAQNVALFGRKCQGYTDCMVFLRAFVAERLPQIAFSCQDLTHWSRTAAAADKVVFCSAYPRDERTIRASDPKKFVYIMHTLDRGLHELPHVWGLTPLFPRHFMALHLPPIRHRPSKTVRIAIQGNITPHRRNFGMLAHWLRKTSAKDFTIQLLGRGRTPPCLLPYERSGVLKISSNLPFARFHDAFADIDGLMALVTPQSHPQYFTQKLTSSVSYSIAYDIPILMHPEMQKIYNVDTYVSDQTPDPILALCQRARTRKMVIADARRRGVSSWCSPNVRSAMLQC